MRTAPAASLRGIKLPTRVQWPGLRAFSGKVDTGFPQKMRPTIEARARFLKKRALAGRARLNDVVSASLGPLTAGNSEFPSAPRPTGSRQLRRRALALVTAVALAGAHAPAQARGAGPKGPPLIRDAEIEQLLKEYTQPILKAAGLSQQNIQIVIIGDRCVQRLRGRRPAHLRQCRCADGCQGAERDHRRARARDRAHRRRPPRPHPRAIGRGLHPVDHRHDPGRGRADRRRAQRQYRHGPGRNGDDPGPAGGDPKFAVRLYPRPGGPGRPRRGEVPDRDRPVGEGHARHLQAARRPDPVPDALHGPVSAVAPAAERARGRARGDGQGQPVLGQEGPAGAAGAARFDARQALRIHRPAGRGGATLPAERHQPRRPLRARDLGLSVLRSAARRWRRSMR